MMGGRCSATRQSSAEEQRRLGFVFLSGEEAADALRNVGIFYLWEGRFIGEARVIGLAACAAGEERVKSRESGGWLASQQDLCPIAGAFVSLSSARCARI